MAAYGYYNITQGHREVEWGGAKTNEEEPAFRRPSSVMGQAFTSATSSFYAAVTHLLRLAAAAAAASLSLTACAPASWLAVALVVMVYCGWVGTALVPMCCTHRKTHTHTEADGVRDT